MPADFSEICKETWKLSKPFGVLPDTQIIQIFQEYEISELHTTGGYIYIYIYQEMLL
jgi:hypothetical protein